MKDILLNWILDNYPGIFICVVFAVVVYFVTKFYYTRYKKTEDKVKELPCNAHKEELSTAKDRTEKLENNITRLPCNTHKEDIIDLKKITAKLETNVDSILKKMDVVCEQLTEITRWIIKTDPTEVDRMAPKFSPRRLSVAGMELYTISGAKKTIEDNEASLIEDIHEMNPLTPLDVEDDSYTVLMRRMSEPMFNTIKNYVYYQPEKVTVKDENGEDVTVRLSMMLLTRLMSIDLRDRYLNKYPFQQE